MVPTPMPLVKRVTVATAGTVVLVSAKDFFGQAANRGRVLADAANTGAVLVRISPDGTNRSQDQYRLDAGKELDLDGLTVELLELDATANNQSASVLLALV